MRYVKLLIVLVAVVALAGCAKKETEMPKKTFGDDVAFLRKYTDVVLLSDSSGNNQVAVLPKLHDQYRRGNGGIELRLD